MKQYIPLRLSKKKYPYNLVCNKPNSKSLWGNYLSATVILNKAFFTKASIVTIPEKECFILCAYLPGPYFFPSLHKINSFCKINIGIAYYTTELVYYYTLNLKMS